MAAVRQWTPERDERLRSAFLALGNDKSVAPLFGVTPKAVQRRRQTLGIRVALRSGGKLLWTPEMDSILRELRGQFSAAIIAEKINVPGVTRSAVVGRAYRLGLDRLPRGGTQQTRRQPKAKAAPRTKSRLRLVISNEEMIADDAIPLEQRKTLLDLEPNDCRWPVGDPHSAEFFFCGGAKVDGCSYCAWHASRAFDFKSRAA